MLVDEGCLLHTQQEPEINIAECVIIARSMTDKDSVGVYIAGDCRVRNTRCAKPQPVLKYSGLKLAHHAKWP